MKISEERYIAFLAVLTETGMIGKACEAIDIVRSTAFKWRKDDPKFAARWDEAVKISQSSLEDEALRRGRDGVEKPVYQRGEQVGVIREYSDGLLQFMLRAYEPGKFGLNNSKVELSGTDGGPIQLSNVDRAEKIKALLAIAQERKDSAEYDGSDLV